MTEVWACCPVQLVVGYFLVRYELSQLFGSGNQLGPLVLGLQCQEARSEVVAGYGGHTVGLCQLHLLAGYIWYF